MERQLMLSNAWDESRHNPQIYSSNIFSAQQRMVEAGMKYFIKKIS